MTSAAFVLRLAWREARAARRRLVLLTASVMAGVGALVAVNSFTENLKVSVAEQAQALLGADLSLGGRKPLADVPLAGRFLDSLQRAGGAGVRTANSTSFAAMAFHPTGGARLVQLRTVDPGGRITAASKHRPPASGRTCRTAAPSSIRRSFRPSVHRSATRSASATRASRSSVPS